MRKRELKKNGFIATSLIYSFFLVFIALVASLLNSFISNKTILDRYNEEIEDKLNSETYTLIVRAKNSNIQDGITLTNLVTNGDFSDGLDFWNTYGSATFSSVVWLNNSAIRKNNNYVRYSYLYQNINFLSGSKYYYALDYSHNSSTSLYSYIYQNSSSSRVVLSNNLGQTWTKASGIYSSNYDESLMFALGYSTSYYSGQTYFSNVMVLNLTASFGKDYEPSKEWVDSNIDWFDGTISYIRKDGIESGNSVTIRFSPYAGYNKRTVTCVNKNNSPISTPNMTTVIENGVTYYNFTVNSITSDISCYVDWKLG